MNEEEGSGSFILFVSIVKLLFFASCADVVGISTAKSLKLLGMGIAYTAGFRTACCRVVH